MTSLNIKALENDLWDAADELRAGSRLSSQEYCMPVLGLIYLRYAFSRFKFVDEEIRKIVGECYKKATEILTENADLVKLIANALLERETLTKEQIEYLVENKKLPKDTTLEDMTLDELKELAKEKDIKGYSKLNKDELIDLLKVNDVKPDLETEDKKDE